jgi:NAD(P)-dependent dehydrogenase (short-subunit alcohol dehydrogenase family)
MNLADGLRVVLVTGARRIGGDVAIEAARRGAHLAILYRSSRTEADETAAAVRELGRRALVMQGDVADPASVARAVEQVDREYGRLDALVSMASLYEKVPFDDVRPEHWHRQLSVDLHGTFHVASAVVPLMRRSGGGAIVNFTDWVAASARPRYRGYLAYYVAKAGVKALTEALALELAADQIRVNAIAPGPILPPEDLPDAEADAVTRSTPLGRWGGAGEIVKAVMALIDSDFITGETIRVDGGRHLS